MFKILIRKDDNNKKPVWGFLYDGKEEFSTPILKVAQEKFLETLETHSLSSSKLVDDLPQNVSMTIPPTHIITILNVEEVINTAEQFVLRFQFTNPSKYVVVDYDRTIFEELKAYLEGLGLSNIRIIDNELHANGNAQNPVFGSYNLPQGLFTFYNRENGSNNNISSFVRFRFGFEPSPTANAGHGALFYTSAKLGENGEVVGVARSTTNLPDSFKVLINDTQFISTHEESNGVIGVATSLREGLIQIETISDVTAFGVIIDEADETI